MPCPGDVEGGAVGGGSADDRQAHPKRGDVAARLQLAGDIHLIVVHADNAVKVAIQRALEDDISRHWSLGADVIAVRIADCRGDVIYFFAAEKPALPAMWIQGGHSDARLSMTQLAEDALQMLNIAPNPLACDLG